MGRRGRRERACALLLGSWRVPTREFHSEYRKCGADAFRVKRTRVTPANPVRVATGKPSPKDYSGKKFDSSIHIQFDTARILTIIVLHSKL